MFLGFVVPAHTDFPELIVTFKRDVHAGASRSELLDGPAAESMPALVW